MPQWNSFLQTMATALFVAIGGGLWAMYVRVLGHGEKINQLEKDAAEERGRLDGLDGRLRVIEQTASRIDANVAELLRVQTRDAPMHRVTDGQGQR